MSQVIIGHEVDLDEPNLDRGISLPHTATDTQVQAHAVTELVTDTEVQPCVSYLREVFPKSNRMTLHQSKITAMEVYTDFQDFASRFWSEASFPTPQSHKFETYGWTPTLFRESNWRPKSKPDATPEYGLWRTGEACTEHVTLGYFDLDNQHDDQPMVEIDVIEAVLREVGVSYVLYTSFSHKPERHKVRIVTPISRAATHNEMFLVYVWLNHALYYQLDGSIYDLGDFLYGPPYLGERRLWTEGAAFDVDAILGIVKELPDEALEYAKRTKNRTGPKRELSDEEIEKYKIQVTDTSISVGVSISNSAYFNPKWMELVTSLYSGGSHRQTLFGIMSKVWHKAKGSLSFGEMRALQSEVDACWDFYCERHYGRANLETDLRSCMALPVSPTPISEADHRKARIEANLRRIARRRKD